MRRTLAARGLPPEFIQQSLAVNEERWRVKCRFGPLRFDASRRYGGFLEQNPDQFGGGTRDPATDVIALVAFWVDLPDALFRDAARFLDKARQRRSG